MTNIFYQIVNTKGREPLVYINFLIGSNNFELVKVLETDSLENTRKSISFILSPITIKLIREFKAISSTNFKALPLNFKNITKVEYQSFLIKYDKI